MLTGKDPIVIPGNHDRKLFGNFKWSLEQLADLEWSNLFVDDESRVVFFCFDSTKGADFARGRVDRDQLLAVGTAYQTRLVNSPELRSYLKIALVHHHPFSFELPPSGAWKVLKKIGIKEEDFLRMEEADKFVSWCGRRGATLILHGHKHVHSKRRSMFR